MQSWSAWHCERGLQFVALSPQATRPSRATGIVSSPGNGGGKINSRTTHTGRQLYLVVREEVDR